MKKALKLFLVYLVYSILAMILGTLFYSLYINVLNYVAGNQFVLFSLPVIKKSMLFTAAGLTFFICPVLAYSRIRDKGGVLQFFAFLIISALAWVVILPVTLKFGNKTFSAPTEVRPLSSSYFRSADNHVYYYMDSLEHSSEIIVVDIDTSQEGPVTLLSVSDDEELGLAQEAAPYRDVLISEPFASDENNPFSIDFNELIRRGASALSSGWTYWLGYLSLGLILVSIYGLSGMFAWNLLNGCVIMLMTLVVLFFNSLFYNGYFDAFKNLKIFNLGFIQAFGKHVDEPVLVIMNVLFAFIFLMVGLVDYIVGRRKARKLRKGE